MIIISYYMELLIISYISFKLYYDVMYYRPIRIGKTYVLKPEDMVINITK